MGAGRVNVAIVVRMRVGSFDGSCLQGQAGHDWTAIKELGSLLALPTHSLTRQGSAGDGGGPVAERRPGV